MAQKKVGDKAVATTLSKLELEIGKLRESIGAAADIDSLEDLVASDGINQSCNGICGGYEQLAKISEAELNRVISAAAKYNIDQLRTVSSLSKEIDLVSDSINQGCNGIC